MRDYSQSILCDDRNLQGFCHYYNERKDLKAPDESLDPTYLSRLVYNFLSDEFSFAIPILKQINKLGSSKHRSIYIFPPDDKLVLRYLNYVLQGVVPMDEHCYSFQRGKSIRDGIRSLVRLETHAFAAIKVDIHDYFNSIPVRQGFDWLEQALEGYELITERLKNLLTSSKVIVDGQMVEVHHKGVMAGMPLAPFLSNLYLRPFDSLMARRFHGYIRYSDDMLFFCEDARVDKEIDDIRCRISEYGLQINEEKTCIYPKGRGFDFLGLHIEADTVELSHVTKKKIKQKIRRASRSIYRWQVKKGLGYEVGLMVMIRKFNKKFYGYDSQETDFTWSKWYFGILTESEGLYEVDQYFQETIRYLASGKTNKSNYRKMPYSMLKEHGYRPLVSEYYKWCE